MKKAILSCLLTSFALVACGGGGGDSTTSTSTTTGTTGTTTPPVVPTTTPVVPVQPTTPVDTGSRPIAAEQPPVIGGFTLSALNADMKGNNLKTVYALKDGGSLNIIGSGNSAKIVDGSKVALIDISGDTNTVVIGKGVIVNDFKMIGASNTIWLPSDSSVVVPAAVLVSNTVKYYVAQ
ncbi:hypothetical protein HA050_11125 [Iodobacter sp. HSC-16F04]|uniref:Lipoprotein n=1 Tax=Iodobacter violaceini TaxID=3044271 RepID=A0ABX0KVF2_9NEIS|nr:hypothetical protein [Iodobacter violacea]NHQ86668.1 hypothetical protein [Iodobacter violacea]